MNMESKDKDLLQSLFVGIPDEALPIDLNEKVMLKVKKEAALREQKRKYLELTGYASGIVAMLAVCVIVFSYFEIAIELPTFDFFTRSFSTVDNEFFKSQSFLFSAYIGCITLFLLIVDSKIRHNIEKKRNKLMPPDLSQN